MANLKHHRPRGQACPAACAYAAPPHRGERALRSRGKHASLQATAGEQSSLPEPLASRHSAADSRRCPWSSGHRSGSRLSLYCWYSLCSESGIHHLPSPLNLLAFSPKFPPDGKYRCYSLGLPCSGNTSEGLWAHFIKSPGSSVPTRAAQRALAGARAGSGLGWNPSLAAWPQKLTGRICVCMRCLRACAVRVTAPLPHGPDGASTGPAGRGQLP